MSKQYSNRHGGCQVQEAYEKAVHEEFLFASFTEYLPVDLLLRQTLLEYVVSWLRYGTELVKDVVQMEAALRDSWSCMVRRDFFLLHSKI